MAGLLSALTGLFSSPAGPRWQHLRLEAWPAVVYAIGDVHGCLDLLVRLESAIAEDAASFEGPKLLIMLGDYIDRGPDSAGVINHLIRPPPPGFERLCLAGNHEAMMLDFLSNPASRQLWLSTGGAETLYSYGLHAEELSALPSKALRDRLAAHLPPEHADFLAKLSLTISLPGATFVHAGLRPGIALDQQSERNLLWSRPKEFPEPSVGLTVHGHTPATLPVIMPHRICVDTGAFATGILSAVRLVPGNAPAILASTLDKIFTNLK